VTGRLIDHDELAVWHRLASSPAGWLQVDHQWSIGDKAGAPVGTVFVDGDLFGRPDYWVRDPAGAAVLGVTHAAGLIGADPWSRIAWADGSLVGRFQEATVLWQDRPIGKWQVDVRRSGTRVDYGGAWLWDAADQPVADVTLVENEAGAYLALHRRAEVDESLQWAAVAFVLVAYEHHRRAQAAAAAARRRRHNRHHH
jgi:hypothetical protein